MADPAEQRLAALRRRWEEDRSSTAFVPLAEEYRRLGRLQDALAVLEQGMKTAPNYLSARVALGRCRLDLGDALGASQIFEQVVQQDPTQLVASKLLVDAYVRSGRPQQARERLNLYAVLNDRDPELEDLRRRVQQATRDAAAEAARDLELQAHEQPATQPAPPPMPAVAEPAAPARDAAPEPPPSLGSPVPAPREASIHAAPAPVGEIFPLAPVDVPRPVLEPLPVRPRPFAPASPDTVFEGLGTAAARRRYVQALLGGEVFGVPMARFDDAPSLASVTAAPPHVGQSAPVFDLPEPEVEAPAVRAPASVPEPTPAVWAAPVEVVPEPFRAAPEPVVPSPPPALVAAAAMAPQPLPPEDEVAEEPLEAPVPPPPVSPAPTATLGELYLSQGHSREAETIFQRVLDAQPGHAAAREGLETARRSADGGGPRPGVTARKIAFLQSYLKRLRKASERHVS